jgi:hypothetical protein
MAPVPSKQLNCVIWDCGLIAMLGDALQLGAHMHYNLPHIYAVGSEKGPLGLSLSCTTWSYIVSAGGRVKAACGSWVYVSPAGFLRQDIWSRD